MSLGWSFEDKLLGIELGAKAFEVFDDDLAGIDVDQAFGLESHEVAGDEFANGAELVGEFLMAGGEVEFDTARGGIAFVLGEFDEGCDEALADGGEGEFLDDGDESAESGAYDLEDFEGDFGVFHAIGLEVAAGDEGDFGVVDGDGGGGERAAVEDGEFGDGFAGDVDGEDLFAAAGGGFEDADFATGDDVESVAGVALGEEQLTCVEGLARGSGS